MENIISFASVNWAWLALYWFPACVCLVVFTYEIALDVDVTRGDLVAALLSTFLPVFNLLFILNLARESIGRVIESRWARQPLRSRRTIK